VRLVVKLGGHALDSLEPDAPVLGDLAEDLAGLQETGVDVAVVHGGGPQIAELLARLGEESRFVEGIRVTTPATLEAVTMALAWVNVKVSVALATKGLRTVGVSAAAAGLLTASPLGAPWGRVGGSVSVDSHALETLWAARFIPVVSPVAVDSSGGLLNVNADVAAGALAGAVGAQRLVLLSDVDQVRADPDDPASALGSIDRATVDALLASGAAREGMRPKLSAALDALSGGAARVTLANGTKPHALREALAGRGPTTEVRT
jgi:acetylglutamate kinase